MLRWADWGNRGQIWRKGTLVRLASGLSARCMSDHPEENATMSRDLVGKDIKLPWLLVTAAAHMPRTHGAFVRAWWNVTAYPVDFETMSVSHWADFSLLEGADLWRNVLREFVGFAIYSLAGRFWFLKVHPWCRR